MRLPSPVLWAKLMLSGWIAPALPCRLLRYSAGGASQSHCTEPTQPPPTALHLRLPQRSANAISPHPYLLVLKPAARQHIEIRLISFLAPDEKGLNQQCKWHSISQSSNVHPIPVGHPWTWLGVLRTTTGSVHKAKQAMPMPCHAYTGHPSCAESDGTGLGWAGCQWQWARRIQTASSTTPLRSTRALLGHNQTPQQQALRPVRRRLFGPALANHMPRNRDSGSLPSTTDRPSSARALSTQEQS